MVAELDGPRLPPRSGGRARQLVVLLHGVGADGADLIGFAPALAQALPDAAFVAPDAPSPCDMADFGRQWFSLQDRSPARLAAGVRAAEPVLRAFLECGVVAAVPARFGARAGRLQPGRDDGAAHRAAHGRGAGRHPRLFRRAAGARIARRRRSRRARRRRCCSCMASRTRWCRSARAAPPRWRCALRACRWKRCTSPGLDHTIDDTGLAAGIAALAARLRARSAAGRARDPLRARARAALARAHRCWQECARTAAVPQHMGLLRRDEPQGLVTRP